MSRLEETEPNGLVSAVVHYGGVGKRCATVPTDGVDNETRFPTAVVGAIFGHIEWPIA